MIYFGTTYKCVLNNFSSSANNPTHANYWVGFSSGTGTGGNGITVDTVGSVSTISTNIVNGTNTIVQYNDDKSIQINASTSGLTTVNGGMAIGVDKTYPSQPTINLLVDRGSGVLINEKDALQLQHGEGLDVILDSDGNGTLVNSGVLSITAGEGISSTGGQNPTITNDGILSITTGSFLTYTDGQNPFITALVAQNSGLVIDTTDPEKPNLYLKHGEGLDVDVDSEFIGTLVNSGVITLTAGTGITSTGGKNPTIANSGVLDLTAGTGLTSTGGQNPTIGNSGVLDLTAGTGITSTGGQNPTIGNSGIITLDVGSGITSTGGQYPTIANSGVLDLTAGTGITITGSKTNYTISAPSVSPTIYTATYWIYTSQNIAGGQPYNTNLRFERETYSTPESMSLASQGAGTGSFSNWICPISGVWSISITMNTLSGTAGVPQGQLVMLQYNNPNEYTPRIVTASEALTFCSSSVTATALLTQGSAYVISSPPAFASYVYVVPKSSWTLTYLGPSP